MPTAARKSRKNSTEPSLRELVEAVGINDDKWRCLVAMLVETSEHQARYSSLLNEACRDGCRKAIRLISRDEALALSRAANNAAQPPGSG